MSEFAVSAAASAKGIEIVIPEDKKPAIRALARNLLQPLCDKMGWRDRINSGYRSPKVNTLVGGAAGSQHMSGEAADNVFYERTPGDVPPIGVLRAVRAFNLDFDQAIAYPSFVHLSYTTRRKNRRQVLYHSSYRGPRL